jgi:hypothetical protein
MAVKPVRLRFLESPTQSSVAPKKDSTNTILILVAVGIGAYLLYKWSQGGGGSGGGGGGVGAPGSAMDLGLQGPSPQGPQSNIGISVGAAYGLTQAGGLAGYQQQVYGRDVFGGYGSTPGVTITQVGGTVGAISASQQAALAKTGYSGSPFSR